jgi:enterochelin esterase-like enzyme
MIFFTYASANAQTSTESVIEEKIVGDLSIVVYLPPGYDKTKTYKVLYCNDGQTIFGLGGLNIDAAADELISRKLIDPIIIVGIKSDRDRTSNYVPYDDEGAREDFGNYTPSADRYTKKIINKLIPYIEKNYAAGPYRGIAGYSFGGLQATWAALQHPAVFKFSAGLSPSYWVHDFKIFTEAAKALKEQRYYFDMGTGEWNYYVPFILHSKLDLLNNVFYYEVKDAHHRVADWSKRMPNVLLLFAGTTDTTKYTWEIQQEIIKSAATQKFYLRINPVISYSNGLTCSLSYAATFTVLNPEDGVVNRDGSFRFINPKDLRVRVSFKGEDKMMKLDYEAIEKIKAGL